MRKLLVLLAAGAFLVAYTVPAIAEVSFRITCDEDGIIVDVERWNGKGWVLVKPKKPPIKGEVLEIKSIHVLLGRVDPCIYQLGEAYCWP